MQKHTRDYVKKKKLHAYSHYTAFPRRSVILHRGTEVPPSGKTIAYPESPRNTPQHGALKYSDFPLPHGPLSVAACPTCAHTKAKARIAPTVNSPFFFNSRVVLVQCSPFLVSTQPGKTKAGTQAAGAPRDGSKDTTRRRCVVTD